MTASELALWTRSGIAEWVDTHMQEPLVVGQDVTLSGGTETLAPGVAEIVRQQPHEDHAEDHVVDFSIVEEGLLEPDRRCRWAS